MSETNFFQEAEGRAIQLRKELGLGNSPIRDMISLLEDLGIFVVVMPIPGDHLSGAFYYDEATKTAKVLINAVGTPGRQRFTAAHELGHYFFDKEKRFIVDDSGEKPAHEKRSDVFAACFLMPQEGVDAYIREVLKRVKKLDNTDLIKLRHEFGVSWSALIYRLHDLGYVFDKPCLEKIKETKILSLMADQFGLEPEYSDKNGLLKMSVDFYRRALNAYQNKKISLNRLAELLRKSYEETKDLVIKMNFAKSHAV